MFHCSVFREYFLLYLMFNFLQKHKLKRILVDFGARSNFISLVVNSNIYFHSWLRHSQNINFFLTTREIKFDLPPKSTNILNIIYDYWTHTGVTTTMMMVILEKKKQDKKQLRSQHCRVWWFWSFLCNITCIMIIMITFTITFTFIIVYSIAKQEVNEH